MAASPLAFVRNLLAPGAGGFSRAGISVIGVRVIAAGLALLAQIIAARLIGPEAFGSYALVLVWLVLLGHASTMGTNQLICRLLASYGAQSDRGAALGLLRFAAAFAGGISLLVAGLALLVVNIGILGLAPEFVLLASIGFIAIPLMMAQDFLEAIARGLDRPLLGIGPAMFLRHLAIICGVGAVFMTGGSADAVTIMAFTIAGLLASVAIQYGLLHRALHQLVGGASAQYRVGFWIRTALPVAVVDIAETLFNNADIIVLGLFVSPDIVAFYFAATRLAQILGYVPYGISAATAQKYAALDARGAREQLQALIGRVTGISTLLAGLGAIVLAVMAPMLLGLFGEGFSVAAPVVLVLSLGLVMACAMGPGEDVLTMLGEERVCALGYLAALVIAIGLHFILIPVWGMIGAALATSAGLVARGTMLALLAHLRLGLILPLGLAHFGTMRKVGVA